MSEKIQESAEQLMDIIKHNLENGKITRKGMYDTLIFWDNLPIAERRDVYDAVIVLLKENGLYEAVNTEL